MPCNPSSARPPLIVRLPYFSYPLPGRRTALDVGMQECRPSEASAGLRQFLTIGSGIPLGLGKTVLPCHGMCRTPIETVASLFAKSIFLRTFASTPRQRAGNT